MLRTAVAVTALCASSSVLAQLKWCCEDPAHAGSTAQERCETNMETFATAKECATKKSEHDQRYGHHSQCSEPVPQTRTGTADGGARLGPPQRSE